MSQSSAFRWGWVFQGALQGARRGFRPSFLGRVGGPGAGSRHTQARTTLDTGRKAQPDAAKDMKHQLAITWHYAPNLFFLSPYPVSLIELHSLHA